MSGKPIEGKESEGTFVGRDKLGSERPGTEILGRAKLGKGSEGAFVGKARLGIERPGRETGGNAMLGTATEGRPVTCGTPIDVGKLNAGEGMGTFGKPRLSLTSSRRSFKSGSVRASPQTQRRR